MIVEDDDGVADDDEKSQRLTDQCLSSSLQLTLIDDVSTTAVVFN